MSLSSATNPTIGGSYRFVCGKTGGRPEKSGDRSAEDQQGTKKARNRRTEGLGGHERILTMQSALPSCKCTFLSEQPPNRLIAKLLKHQGEWWEGRSLRCPRLPSPHKRFKANNQNKTSTNARLAFVLGFRFRTHTAADASLSKARNYIRSMLLDARVIWQKVHSLCRGVQCGIDGRPRGFFRKGTVIWWKVGRVGGTRLTKSRTAPKKKGGQEDKVYNALFVH